jgi:hypothetical protein
MFGLTATEEQAIALGPKRVATALQILQYIAEQKDGATCDECIAALGVPHQAASPRYYELVMVGCLVPTGKKRTTRMSSSAVVHKVAKDADFKKYLSRRRIKKAPAGLTELQQQVLAAGMAFIQSWKRGRTAKVRENAAVKLVNQLGTLANEKGNEDGDAEGSGE